MKRFSAISAMLLLSVFVLMLAGCAEEDVVIPSATEADVVMASAELSDPNPTDAIQESATVTVVDGGGPAMMAPGVTEVSTLIPVSLTVTLKPGESVSEHKTGYVPGAPPSGELMFALDLTGSMGGELGNAKANSINIMNAIRGLIPNTNFGVISHMDYNGVYGGCGYGPYAYGSGLDYQYKLDQPLTSSTASVATAINDLTLGYGNDGPESSKTVLHNLCADGGIGWGIGTKKIAILWGDNIPHDCAIGTGEEPGLDGVSMTTVMGNLATANITPIFLHSGYQLAYWQGMAALAGGTAVQIDSSGIVPGGTDLAQFIVDLIEAEVSTVDEFTLEVCDLPYSGWLTSVVPASYTDVEPPATLEFDIVITVPEGTEPGDHCFKVCLVGDGVIYATQEVCITVCAEVEIEKLTPQTFNVQRAGVPVKLHLIEGPSPVVKGTIISIGGFDTKIASLDVNGPLTFPSDEFSVDAALVVPEGFPRAEDVPVIIVLEFEDGTIGCPATAYLDIINEGKPGGGKK